jgi:hypothetical protein
MMTHTCGTVAGLERMCLCNRGRSIGSVLIQHVTFLLSQFRFVFLGILHKGEDSPGTPYVL